MTLLNFPSETELIKLLEKSDLQPYDRQKEVYKTIAFHFANFTTMEDEIELFLDRIWDTITNKLVREDPVIKRTMQLEYVQRLTKIAKEFTAIAVDEQ